ncbi:SIR2 family protein [Spiroplasma tabanidicola]|uniref:Uncharacterized protein n=1 Tax=Spiroplasma tabanidicola TaxID=324079 RepID=A0A6I6CCH7_9MOLU|nr:SIR2 family protein [Spiroplasma tabanidicola]QGS51978.1 hypothetical protein STABA_v1c06150 [Spiroplasma tabanidicola]
MKFLTFLEIKDNDAYKFIYNKFSEDNDSFIKQFLRAAIGNIDYDYTVNIDIIIFLNSIFNKLKNNKTITIFSLNYDVLLEKMADFFDFNINNGFSGVLTRTFKISQYDTIKYTNSFQNQRIKMDHINLVKLHGLIGWEKENNNIIEKQIDFYRDAVVNKLLIKNLENSSHFILHTSNKFNESNLSIYSDLFRYFKNVLSIQKTNIVVCSYSLNDTHVNSLLFDSLYSNSSLEAYIFVYDYYDKNNKRHEDFVKLFNRGHNLNIFFFFLEKNFLISV